MTASATAPDRTAWTRASPHGPCGPGMTRSSPPFAAAAAVFVANQSDMTSPEYPHSPLTISLIT